ncbi:MAG: 4-hydroxy-tetrahydrodipicolinate reductase [Pseudomonadota bacterium]
MKHSLWIHGLSGKMGHELQTAVSSSDDFVLEGGSALDITQESTRDGIQKSAVIVDFSSPKGTEALLAYSELFVGKTILFCTTGLDSSTLEKIKKLGANNNVMLAPNTSIGVFLFGKILSAYGQILFQNNFDIEIVETHHRHKIDSPSGTAKFLRAAVDPDQSLSPRSDYNGVRNKRDIGMHAIRGGGVAGEHSVRFLSDSEELEITHRAFQRSLFATGALALVRILLKKSHGFYDYGDISPAEMLKSLPLKE